MAQRWRWMLAFTAIAWLDYQAVMEAVIHLHYLRPPQWISNLNDPGFALESVPINSAYITSDSGNVLGVWSLERIDSNFTIIYLHGQLGTRGQGRRRRVLSFLFEHLEANVVTYDPSGYADSTGWPTSGNLKKDAVSVIAWARDKFKTRIIIWGHSLGGPIAAHAASLGLTDGLVLESTFSRLCNPAINGIIGLPFWLVPLSIREWLISLAINATIGDHLDTVGYVKDVSVPILLMHGGLDLIVPVENFKHLKMHAKNVHEILVPEAGHNNLYVYDFVEGFANLVKPEVQAWLAKLS